MNAFLLVLALFAGWSLIGVGVLTVVGADCSDLRVVLTAPALGLCVTALVVFLCSEAGAAVGSLAAPVAASLLVGAAAVVVVRRPQVHPGAAVVAIAGVLALLLVAEPLFSLGYHWLANGNDDMANYVLSAQTLLKHGLLAPYDLTGLVTGRDYATVLGGIHRLGGRPGSDLLLAFASQLSGHAPYEAFMPVILALDLCGACAVGALALQVARPWWAAVVAAVLAIVAPMASYGVLQQLLGQVFGLTVAAALLALLLRPELHRARARAASIVPIALLAAGLILGYVELAPTIALAYGVYLAVLGVRREIDVHAALRLLLPVGLIVLVLLNGYLLKELSFLRNQASTGLKATSGPPLFGFMLVPSGLPGVIGLQTTPPSLEAPNLEFTIVLAAVLLAAVIAASVVGAWRGIGACTVLVVEACLGVALAINGNDFGLFKLAMYVQPFLAAALAAWIARPRRSWARVVVGAGALALVVSQLSTQHAYVQRSRAPGDVPDLSASDVIPAFGELARHAHVPVVSVTENPVLIKLEAAASGSHGPVFFLSRNVFGPLLASYSVAAPNVGWARRSFDLLAPGGTLDGFEEDDAASAALVSGRCTLVVPTRQILPFNAYSLPVGGPDLAEMPCEQAHDLLAFTSSQLGQSFYLPTERRYVSFFQLQGDPFALQSSMVGFGRYALFRALGFTPGSRLAISLTDSFIHDGQNRLPPAAVVGSARVALPLLGRGSARVFSAPLDAQTIAGGSYLMLDMGVAGRLPVVPRPGINGLYGTSVPIDPRYLTSYVRDVSLISPTAYSSLHRPAAIASFPAGLANPDLEYSGIYEDGWVGSEAFAVLTGGPRAELRVQGEIPAGAGRHLEVLVNGRTAASLAVAPGHLDARIPLGAAAGGRKVVLRFASVVRLKAPDLRPAAAHLTFLGLVAAAR